jgi:hypothetical protein
VTSTSKQYQKGPHVHRLQSQFFDTLQLLKTNFVFRLCARYVVLMFISAFTATIFHEAPPSDPKISKVAIQGFFSQNAQCRTHKPGWWLTYPSEK